MNEQTFGRLLETLRSAGDLQRWLAGVMTLDELWDKAKSYTKTIEEYDAKKQAFATGSPIEPMSGADLTALSKHIADQVDAYILKAYYTARARSSKSVSMPTKASVDLTGVYERWKPFRNAAEPQPPLLPEVELDECVVGYRYWNLRECVFLASASPFENLSAVLDPSLPYAPSAEVRIVYRLASPVKGNLWNGPILSAPKPPCAYNPHDDAYKHRSDHSHGIYAHRSADALPLAYGRVLGRVEMWGTVIEHVAGYRAEHARITDLYVNPAQAAGPLDQVVADLQSTYQCDVHTDLLEVYAAWFKESQ